MFSPIAHVFGMDHPGYKEPWNYGEDALRIFKQYDLLRYRLIPYIYSHSYEMYQTGMPLMRALVLEYQDDENVFEIADQYMFGSSMMICPVTEKGAQTRVVYLPEGNWINYWTGELYEGKEYYSVLTPLDQMPIFVKEGSIIPMQDAPQFIGAEPVPQIKLDIYPGKDASFELYEDDGKSMKYQEGVYALTSINSKSSEKEVTVSIAKPEGSFQLPDRSYLMQIHMESAPKSVSVNTKSLNKLATWNNGSAKGWYFDNSQKLLYIHPEMSKNKEIAVSILKN